MEELMQRVRLLSFELFAVLFVPYLINAQNSNVNLQIAKLSLKIVQSYNELEISGNVKQIAITEFSNVGSLAQQKNMGAVVSELLTNKLASTNSFTVIERSQLNKVLDELALGQTGLLEKSAAQEVGFLLGAQAIITGSITEAGEFFIVNARMIDVQKGDIKLAESVEIKQADLIALSSKKVVVKKYPLTSAFRSTVLPGWGQFYNDSPTKGYVFIGATAAALGATIYFKLAGDADYEKYQDNTLESVQYFDSANDNYDMRDIAMYTTLGKWLINIAEAFIEASMNLNDTEELSGKRSNINLGMRPEYGGASLSVNWSL